MKQGTLVREFEVSRPLRVEIVGGASDVALRAHQERKARVEMAYKLHCWVRTTEREKIFLENPPVRFAQDLLQVGPEPEGVTLDYVLYLPPEAEVEVTVSSGDVSAQGLTKKLRISTGSGDIVLKDVSGEVRLRCGSGDIELERVFGAISAGTGSGDIQGEEIKGAVDLETGSGNIELKGVEGELRIITGSGDVRVAGELSAATWRIDTGAGDVHLELSEGTEAEVVLHSDYGDIHCALPITAQEVREGRLVGRLGAEPKARLLVKTGTGDITVDKR